MSQVNMALNFVEIQILFIFETGLIMVPTYYFQYLEGLSKAVAS